VDEEQGGLKEHKESRPPYRENAHIPPAPDAVCIYRLCVE